MAMASFAFNGNTADTTAAQDVLRTERGQPGFMALALSTDFEDPLQKFAPVMQAIARIQARLERLGYHPTYRAGESMLEDGSAGRFIHGMLSFDLKNNPHGREECTLHFFGQERPVHMTFDWRIGKDLSPDNKYCKTFYTAQDGLELLDLFARQNLQEIYESHLCQDLPVRSPLAEVRKNNWKSRLEP